MPTICIVSDTHNQYNNLVLPKADWIIHAGDMTSTGKFDEIANFMEWFGKTDYSKRIVIAGNHDFLFETEPYMAKTLVPENVIYLESSSVEIDGIKIYGEPRQPFFFNWAFNVHRGEAIKKYWMLSLMIHKF